jgi:tetratricopeptide (TPR) repeat protein
VAQHISRSELKKDQVRETFAHGAEVVLSHQKLTMYILGAAIVIAAGAFGVWTYMQRQASAASGAFDSAIRTFQTPAGVPAAPGETVYPDDAQKFTAAAKQFSDVAAKYPRTRGGQLARYFEALSDEKIGKNDDAKKLLRDLAAGNDDEAAVLSRFELAQLDETTGQGDEAAKLYQQLIDKPSILVPKPVAMLALAEHYGQTNPAQAAKLYIQIKTDYPDTPIAQQAEQALSLLPGRS